MKSGVDSILLCSCQVFWRTEVNSPAVGATRRSIATLFASRNPLAQRNREADHSLQQRVLMQSAVHVGGRGALGPQEKR